MKKPRSYHHLYRTCCLFLFVSLSLLSYTLSAQQTVLLEWAKVIPSSTNVPTSVGIVNDASGNVYVVGEFSGTADFDPGTAVVNATSAGFRDIFVVKLDVNGNFVWLRTFGSTGVDNGYSILIDPFGNLVIAGIFQGTVDFDPGAGVTNLVSNAGGQSFFILKMDTDGNLIWAKSINANNNNNYEGDQYIATDPSGNIYLTGGFYNTGDFDPGSATFNLTATGADIFFEKLDVNGNFVWAKAFGGSQNEFGYTIALDASSNIFLTADLHPVTDVDPGPPVVNLPSTGSNDVFILKTDNAGNFIWAKGINSTNRSHSESLALDAAGNVYMTGYFLGTADFDPGAGVYNLTEVGGYDDLFTWKLDNNGNFLWANAIGGSANCSTYSTEVDAAGNVYSIGSFPGTLDFDPGPATFNLTTPGSASNVWISKLDKDGNFVWAKSEGGVAGAVGTAIHLDVSGVLYTTGYVVTSGDFDPNPCVFTLTAATYGAFVQKLVPGTFLSPTITSFSPNSGPIGTSVTITGTNFSTILTDNVVKFFNNKSATVTASTTTSITVTVPAGTTTGPISVTTNCVTVTSTDFTVTGATAPTITSFTPASGPVGQSLVITGTNFSTTPVNNTVKLNGTTATVTASTATSITTSVPSGATTGLITVTVAGLTATSATNFTVTTPTVPTITSFTPSSGIVGATVTITGTNFSTTASNNIVKFNGVTAVALSSTATSIVTTVPSGATSGKITVTVGGNTATSVADFTVIALPTITSFTPSSGLVGTSVTITGTNFSPTVSNNTVKFNGTTAVVASATATSITTSVPAGATSGKIMVTVGTNTATSANDFTVTVPPPATGTAPVIASTTISTSIGGTAVINLTSLLSDVDNDLDLGSLKVIAQPKSGAPASIDSDKNLLIDYTGNTFAGKDEMSIEVCDLSSKCVQSILSIDVSGDIIVYNALSPNGSNPTFHIRNIESLPETRTNSVTIFDRWQNEVWTGSNYDNSAVVFKGVSSGGTDLPSGIYFYKIEFTSGRKSQTGFISLKR